MSVTSRAMTRACRWQASCVMLVEWFRTCAVRRRRGNTCASRHVKKLSVATWRMLLLGWNCYGVWTAEEATYIIHSTRSVSDQCMVCWLMVRLARSRCAGRTWSIPNLESDWGPLVPAWTPHLGLSPPPAPVWLLSAPNRPELEISLRESKDKDAFLPGYLFINLDYTCRRLPCASCSAMQCRGCVRPGESAGRPARWSVVLWL